MSFELKDPFEGGYPVDELVTNQIFVEHNTGPAPAYTCKCTQTQMCTYCRYSDLFGKAKGAGTPAENTETVS